MKIFNNNQKSFAKKGRLLGVFVVGMLFGAAISGFFLSDFFDSLKILNSNDEQDTTNDVTGYKIIQDEGQNTNIPEYYGIGKDESGNITITLWGNGERKYVQGKVVVGIRKIEKNGSYMVPTDIERIIKENGGTIDINETREYKDLISIHVIVPKGEEMTFMNNICKYEYMKYVELIGYCMLFND